VEAGKSRKQKRTAKQLYGDLVALGYDARMLAWPPLRDWKRGRQYEADQRAWNFRAAGFQPGEPSSSTGARITALLGGKQVKLQVAHTKLSHSRAYIVRAYLLQTHEMLLTR
jgi:hypothetical protein